MENWQIEKIVETQAMTTQGQRKKESSAEEASLGEEVVDEEDNARRVIGKARPTQVPADNPEI